MNSKHLVPLAAVVALGVTAGSAVAQSSRSADTIYAGGDIVTISTERPCCPG
jgi:hypothetical protein